MCEVCWLAFDSGRYIMKLPNRKNWKLLNITNLDRIMPFEGNKGVTKFETDEQYRSVIQSSCKVVIRFGSTKPENNDNTAAEEKTEGVGDTNEGDLPTKEAVIEKAPPEKPVLGKPKCPPAPEFFNTAANGMYPRIQFGEVDIDQLKGLATAEEITEEAVPLYMVYLRGGLFTVVPGDTEDEFGRMCATIHEL